MQLHFDNNKNDNEIIIESYSKHMGSRLCLQFSFDEKSHLYISVEDVERYERFVQNVKNALDISLKEAKITNQDAKQYLESIRK